MTKFVTIELGIKKLELSPEIVLLTIGGLKIPNIREGAIAKALSNGSEVTKEMVMPFLTELQEKNLIIRQTDEYKKFKHTIPVPTIALTVEGEKEIARLKTLQN